MSMTPFQAHRARKQKEREAEKLRAPATDAPTVDPTDYEQFEALQYAMRQDVQAVADTPSGERQAKKAERVEHYRDHVEKYIESGEVYANPVLTQVIIWLFDLGQIVTALKYADVAIAQNQAMPLLANGQPYKRNLPTTVADSVFAWAEDAAKAGNSYEPYFSDTRAKLDAWKVHNAVKMKYAKFAGLQAYDTEDWKTAEKELAAAEGFADQKHPAKVKTKLDIARKKLSENA